MFQSTRPVRGATDKTIFASGEAGFQSTRPVRGATYCCCTALYQ
ncbi:sigma-54 dependent DNA-binding transcriptional regulator [Centipeda periodontii DSM 2778]|uniref:Sigma-54 dependent DNA-binding transcriptional regulator n=1 Tax=Centipeda periodontii DSM 2778 TaxID=888060 RepID=F5RNS8_9FIRM|nr:sigma-54 dependent DNA-binding transcriptional regulator [Centipeda periodontii DSM 2778]